MEDIWVDTIKCNDIKYQDNASSEDNNGKLFFQRPDLGPCRDEELLFVLFSRQTLRMDLIQRNNVDMSIQDIITIARQHDLANYKRILITLENKDYDDIDDLLELKLDIYIDVLHDRSICTFNEFKNMRYILRDFKQRFSTYNLTPLEKITIAYDYVKFFLYNKEESISEADSRATAKVLSTGNIVCEGYSRLFSQLLMELNISSYLVIVAIIADNGEELHHMRNLIYITDEKYGIDGPFFFDSTWDSYNGISLVKTENGNIVYKLPEKIDTKDVTLEKLPSEINYIFYLVPLHEYNKYFKNEVIMQIMLHSTDVEIDIDEFNELISTNRDGKIDDTVISILPKVLLKTKKIEGYSVEQINLYINHAINILEHKRFGKTDQHSKKDVQVR